MDSHDTDPLPADLAFCEAELEEWDQLKVQDHWDRLITGELGALPTPADWSELSAGEQTRLRRHERRTENTLLRLITTEADAVTSAPNLEEVA